MARKKIREYDSKRLLKEQLKRLTGIDLQICSAQMASFGDIGVAAGINILFAVAFLLAFAFLRLQPINDRVHFPKWYIKGLRSSPMHLGSSVSKFVNLDWRSYVRFLNWVPDALSMPEPELIDHAGLDSAVYLQIYLLGLKVFVPVALLAWSILVPVNWTNNTLAKALATDKWFWTHIVMAYAFTFWTCYTLLKEYATVAKMRLHFLASERRRPDQFTVLVRNVPPDPDESVSELVEHFFMVNHPNHYLTNQVVINANKLAELVNEKKSKQNWLDYFQIKYSRNQSKRPMTKTGFLGLCGTKVDVIDYQTAEIERLSKELRILYLLLLCRRSRTLTMATVITYVSIAYNHFSSSESPIHLTLSSPSKPFFRTHYLLRTMARKKIREYDSKRLLKEHLKRLTGIDLQICSAQVTESTDFTDLTNKEAWLSSTKLVVKPDMLFGKRGKSGLVALNLDLTQVAGFVKERLGVELRWEVIVSERLGCTIRFSECGGIEIEENWDKVKTIFLPTEKPMNLDACAPLIATLPLEEFVVTLDHSNFTDFVAKHKFIEVEFYAPWCGHCKKLAPEYEKAASVLSTLDPPVVLAKVDANVDQNKVIANGFEVKGYPTLKILRYGGSAVQEFKGPRDADGIVALCKKAKWARILSEIDQG
ncbi:hypothetical protein CASFOL_034437 [Castilleja foliolosa]|uniref:Thioredoxin domain-containing protein n=1 Tax=Castilleja foliolosa TaxID=1961234 RepID=A0ABD3BWW7_9LAMI